VYFVSWSDDGAYHYVGANNKGGDCRFGAWFNFDFHRFRLGELEVATFLIHIALDGSVAFVKVFAEEFYYQVWKRGQESDVDCVKK